MRTFFGGEKYTLRIQFGVLKSVRRVHNHKTKFKKIEQTIFSYPIDVYFWRKKWKEMQLFKEGEKIIIVDSQQLDVIEEAKPLWQDDKIYQYNLTC